MQEQSKLERGIRYQLCLTMPSKDLHTAWIYVGRTHAHVVSLIKYWEIEE